MYKAGDIVVRKHFPYGRIKIGCLAEVIMDLPTQEKVVIRLIGRKKHKLWTYKSIEKYDNSVGNKIRKTDKLLLEWMVKENLISDEEKRKYSKKLKHKLKLEEL